MNDPGATTQQYPGMERLSEMMLRLIESEEPRRSSNQRRETPNPGSMAQQRSIMVEETRRALAELLQRGTAGIFALSPAQLRTLESMEIPEDLRNEVVSLNLLRTRGGQYRVNERLNTVMALPPTPPGGRPTGRHGGSTTRPPSSESPGPRTTTPWRTRCRRP